MYTITSIRVESPEDRRFPIRIGDFIRVKSPDTSFHMEVTGFEVWKGAGLLVKGKLHSSGECVYALPQYCFPE